MDIDQEFIISSLSRYHNVENGVRQGKTELTHKIKLNIKVYSLFSHGLLVLSWSSSVGHLQIIYTFPWRIVINLTCYLFKVVLAFSRIYSLVNDKWKSRLYSCFKSWLIPYYYVATLFSYLFHIIWAEDRLETKSDNFYLQQNEMPHTIF